MRILILDDDLKRHTAFARNLIGHEVVHAETVTTTIHHLNKGEVFDAVFLDHDLGGEVYVESGGDKPTGYDVATWLLFNSERCPNIVIIHSFNKTGALKMKALLDEQDISALLYLPGVWDNPNLSASLTEYHENHTTKQ
jgi:hypothetical protein